ncbi:uncharacterized protein FIESC28_00070 [Fusarium coffeatum]|uniref:Uncharacterized protein n=1 Tax=Fusarium coffeatum TaxID=231269 RepID=A0A366SEN2_9HYPO|nr:uncharacterized protein FIESC28_00070 [Fusarium coffeatum]RBR27126.1 hypothetical protein FIESC28_00070 [Fusarium coffeatum]
MSIVGPLEDADSSQIHLLKEHIPPYSSATSYVNRDITEEQEHLAYIEESNAGFRSTKPSDNGYQLDGPSRAPCATGITIRKASRYKRNSKGRELAKLNKKESILWVWRLEPVLMCVGTGFFAAICLILNKYNGEELPDWDLMGLTLNTLISILGTFFRAIVALITFEIIAQRKWTWLSHDSFKPRRDVEIFDSASRGMFGCLRLVPVIMIRDLVALGAIAVAVLTLGIGSFTQQSIQTYQCLREMRPEDGTATIAVANTIQLEDFTTLMANLQLNVKMKIAMSDAMVSPNDVSSLFNYPSGNCTFATYSDSQDNTNLLSHSSLGMCSRCIDLYNLVRHERPSGPTLPINYSLPVEVGGERMRIALGDIQELEHGTYINVATGMNLSWTHQVATPDLLNRARWSIANITLLGISEDHCGIGPDSNITCPNTCSEESRENRSCFVDSRRLNGRPTDYAAAACIIYPCIRYYRAQFRDSKPEETVVWDVPMRKQWLYGPLLSAGSGPLRADWKGIMQPCLVNGTLFTTLNMSSPSHTIPNPRELVFHAKNWASESMISLSITRGVVAVAGIDRGEGYEQKECLEELDPSLSTHGSSWRGDNGIERFGQDCR